MSTSGEGTDPDATLPGVATDGVEDTVLAPSGNDPPPGDTHPGTMPETVGKYRVLHRLGEGGMGVVYAAEDPELKRKVAIKLVRPALEGSRGGDAGKARLLREAQALARLSSHPNIVNVYEVGTLGNRVFIVMEFIEGIPLLRWQFVRTGGWREVLRAYRAAGRALVAAHAGGVVHRDFKAENVLVREDGEVRVLDFGLASEASDGAAPSGAASRLRVEPGALDAAVDRLTQTGALLGTPAYMSPEQLAGERIDERSDQFSFCVSLYEALYGERPHAGETLGQLILSVSTGEVREPPRFVKVPPWVRKVLLRGLAVDPDARWPSMRALLAALDRDPRRMMGMGATLFGALAVAGGIWGVAGHLESRERARADAVAVRAGFLEARATTAETAGRRHRELDPGGSWNRFVLSRAAEILPGDPSTALAALLHLREPDDRTLVAARLLADAALRGPVARVTVSLPGVPRHLGWLREHVVVAPTEGPVHIVAAATGTTREVQVAGRPEAMATARSGDLFVVGGPWGVQGVGADGGARFEDPTAATALALSADAGLLAVARPGGAIEIGKPGAAADRVLRGHPSEVRRLAISADGAHLASMTSDGLRLWDLARDTHRELEVPGRLQGLAFAPTVLRAVDEQGRGHAWDLAKPVARRADLAVGIGGFDLAADGERFVGVAKKGSVVWGRAGETRVLARDARLAALSADGGTAAVAGPASLTLWSLDAGAPDRVGVGDQVNRLALDRDGAVVAGLRSGALLRLDQATRTVTEIASGPGAVATWAFAPDGTRLALTTSDGALGVTELATGEDRSLRDHSQFPAQPLAWSAASDRVAASTCEVGQRCIAALYPVTGETPTRMPGQHGPLVGLALSPDERWLVGLERLSCEIHAWDLQEARRVEIERAGILVDATCLAWDVTDGRVRVARTRRLREGQEGAPRWFAAHEIDLRTGAEQLLFSRDDLVLVVGDRGGKAMLLADDPAAPLLWDLARATFHPMPPLPAAVENVALSHDGTVAHLGMADGVRSIDLVEGVVVERPRPAEINVWTDAGVLVEFAGGDLVVHRRRAPAIADALAEWIGEQTARRLDLDRVVRP